MRNSDNFDLSDWKLGLPIDQDGGITGTAFEILDLNGFEHSSYFYAANDGAMVFHANVDGAISKGTTAARSELREMDGNAQAAWTLDEGGTMTATLRVDEAPVLTDGSEGKIVVGQIHGADEELVRLYWDDGEIYYRNDKAGNGISGLKVQLTDSKGETAHVSLGEQFSYEIDVHDGKLTVLVHAGGDTYSSTADIQDSWRDDHYYFKAGAYLGNNETNSTGAGQVSFYGLDFSHTDGDGLGGLSVTTHPAGNQGSDGGSYHADSTGTIHADALYGGDLSDVIYSYGGNDIVHAGAGDDRIVGGSGDDRLLGEGGSDTIHADDGNDIVYGGDGNNTLDGGAGDDVIKVDSGTNSITGGDGNDSIYGGTGNDMMHGGTGDDTVSTGGGNDTVYGDDGNDWLRGGTGTDTMDGGNGDDKLYGEDANDTLKGGDGSDRLDGGTGNDTLYGENGDDVLVGQDGSDVLHGGNDNDTIYGYADNDKLYGDAGNDKLVGGDGDDTMYGGDGNDRLYADAGADNLYGGAGADVFEFMSLDSSTLTATGRDDIYQFSHSEGDLLSFAAIDADSTRSGRQAFQFIGTAAFDGHAGELRYVNTSSETYIYGDVNGDGQADFSIHVDGAIHLQSDDFIL